VAIHRKIRVNIGLFLAEEQPHFDDEPNEKADWNVRDLFRVFSVSAGPA
jgi:hypothetical protein